MRLSRGTTTRMSLPSLGAGVDQGFGAHRLDEFGLGAMVSLAALSTGGEGARA